MKTWRTRDLYTAAWIWQNMGRKPDGWETVDGMDRVVIVYHDIDPPSKERLEKIHAFAENLRELKKITNDILREESNNESH